MIMQTDQSKESEMCVKSGRAYDNVLLVRHVAQEQYRILPFVAAELRKLGLRSRPIYDLEPKLKHKLWTLGKPTAVVS
ncbi:MAG: hypothetical protein HY351_01535, partial [Candidatus Omnitrophica bacterium]|nr:hypothetical protein [Candidatus Omnitrophota bacterium]